MIKGRAGKVSGVVTNAAVLVRRNMDHRFTNRVGIFEVTVVTRRAIAGDAHVIKNRRDKGRCCVTEVAVLERGNMVYPFFAGNGKAAVMTAFTTVNNVPVYR